MSRLVIFSMTLVMCIVNLNAQISEGGMPYSTTISELKSAALLPELELTLSETAIPEDEQLRPGPFYFGIYTDTLIDVKLHGKVDVISGKGRIWRYRISSDEAKSIQVIFKTFLVPEGASLFLYNDDQSVVKGAFTKKNMRTDSLFVLANFKGNHVIIEYFEPDNPEFEGKVVIGSISQAYRNALSTESLDDYVNVNCPSGKNAQLAKHAVCKIVFKTIYKGETIEASCSGALINNAKNDGTPYFLTAHHCISTVDEASSLTAYFNYENVGCDGDALEPLTLTGSELLTTASASDYTLLKLNDTPTAEYQSFYAGWDARDTTTKMVTSVHHPEGYTKKISIDYDSIYAYPSKIYWEDESVSDSGTHWVVIFDEGITNEGSSGSPLFNSKNQIIGQLHGGDDTMDLYGMFNYSYAYKPSQYHTIRKYLDPDSTGISTLEGYYPSDNIPDAFFYSPYEKLCVNSSATLNDCSAFGPYERNWTITPASYSFLEGTTDTSENPVIEFHENDVYTIQLNLSVEGEVKSSESNTISVGNTLLIEIKAHGDTEACDCDFETATLSASGAYNYTWSVDPDDENKVSLNDLNNDTLIVTRRVDFIADTAYSLNFQVVGTMGECSDTATIAYSMLKPPNDNIAKAILLDFGKSDIYSNLCGTIEDGEPVPPCTACVSQYAWCDEYGTGEDIVENSVWFKFIPDQSYPVTISSTGFDNEIALYEADTYQDILSDNYTLVAANDDRSSTDARPFIKTIQLEYGKTYWIQIDGSGGGQEGDFYLVINDVTVGLSEDISNHLMIYPQPAQDYIVIRGDEISGSDVRITVTNMSGQQLITKNQSISGNEVFIDISALNPGIYFINLINNTQVFTARMIKY